MEGVSWSNGRRTHIQGAIGCNNYMRHGQVANLALCQRQQFPVLAERFQLMFRTHPGTTRRSSQQSGLFFRRRELQSTS